MKSSTATFYVLASLGLVFSLTALILVGGGNNFFTPNKTANTQTPTPDGDVTFSYTFSNFEKLNTNENKVTLSVTLQYQGKNDITIDYSQFYIVLYVYNEFGEPVETALTFTPQNHGTVRLGPAHPAEVIKLTFQYPTEIEYDGKTATTYYYLQYKAN
ncbi:MAG: hypothetical protein ACQCN5_00490 [Candidatus Bathyarchaeia archaeon]|jgi:ABC-type antimicrobial peptide transport system permease subunit